MDTKTKTVSSQKAKLPATDFTNVTFAAFGQQNNRCYNKNNRWRLPLCLGTTMVSKELCLPTTSKTPTRLLIKPKWSNGSLEHDLNIGSRVHQGELQPPIQISAGTVGLVSIGWFKCWTFEERCLYVLYIFQVEQHHEHGTVRKQSDWPAGHQLGCELTSNNSGSNLKTAGITKEGKPTILQITCNYLIWIS